MKSRKKTFYYGLASLLMAGAVQSHAATKPAWAGNKLGKKALGPDYIDPGFAPVTVTGNTIKSGLKAITLNKFGLPVKCSYGKWQILKSPVRLAFEDDRAVVCIRERNLKNFKLEKLGKNAALVKSTFEAAGVRFEVSGKFDFDFTATYDIKVTPLTGKARIKKLALVFPVNVAHDQEKLIMYYKEGPNRPESGLDAQKRRVYQTIKGRDYRQIMPGFCSIFWVGTTNYGLSWCFESAKDWNPVKGNELTFDPGSGSFCMNFIQKNTVIGKSLNYRFFLTPTPVKTMPKNWRAWNYSWRGSAKQKIDRKLFNELIYWSSTWRLGKDGFNPLWIGNSNALKKAAEADKGMNKANYYIPQLVTSQISVEDENGNVHVLQDKYLQELCRKYHRKPGMAGRKLDIPEDAIIYKHADAFKAKGGEKLLQNRQNPQVSCTWDVVFTPPLADHMVYALNNFINKYGIGGIYYDGINPQQNYSKWAAWTDQDGKLRPFFHFSDQRALLKRMRCLVKNNDPNEVVVAHQSGVRPPATLSLCDAIIPGETFFYWYHEPEKRDASPNGDFYYAHIVGDIDNLKGEFFHRQWGVPHILLPEVRGKNGRIFSKPARGTRTMLAYTIHFDMLYFPTMCDVKEIYKWYKIRNEYGMADTKNEKVEFVPYWENRLFKSDNKNVKVSYYTKNSKGAATGKYMVLASNLQFSDCKFTIKLPEGLKKVKVREMQTNKILPVKAGKINYSLIAYDFAIFEITAEQGAK